MGHLRHQLREVVVATYRNIVTLPAIARVATGNRAGVLAVDFVVYLYNTREIYLNGEHAEMFGVKLRT